MIRNQLDGVYDEVTLLREQFYERLPPNWRRVYGRTSLSYFGDFDMYRVDNS